MNPRLEPPQITRKIITYPSFWCKSKRSQWSCGGVLHEPVHGHMKSETSLIMNLASLNWHSRFLASTCTTAASWPFQFAVHDRGMLKQLTLESINKVSTPQDRPALAPFVLCSLASIVWAWPCHGLQMQSFLSLQNADGQQSTKGVKGGLLLK